VPDRAATPTAPATVPPPVVLIRDMTAADADAVLRIYGEGIATGHATFEAEVPEWDRFISGKLQAPRLVAEVGGKVAGWAACSPFSTRPVYRGVAEHSVYVSADARGLGVGRTLLSTLLEDAEAAGLWLIESRVFPENRASLALHMACGFRVVGRYNRMGKMPYGPLAGQWRDCIIVAWRSAGDPA
jgi:L-amino acid N-acyltransferase YncA